MDDHKPTYIRFYLCRGKGSSLVGINQDQTKAFVWNDNTNEWFKTKPESILDDPESPPVDSEEAEAYASKYQISLSELDQLLHGCPFCQPPADRVLAEYKSFLVIRDIYPVTHLHTLIISREHKKTYFDLSASEVNELHKILHDQKAVIESEDSSVKGFNIGANVNEVSGQTVPHFHLHLIPRRNGDMDDPRGGVRGVIPEKQKY